MEHNELNNDCVMPDCKALYEDVVKEAEYWKQECQHQSSEVIYLRAVKQTVEAFLGRKIGDG